MSGRGGGGGGWRGGRGGGGRFGRGGGALGNGLGPTISFQDLQDVNALDKTPMKLYPEMHNLPSLGRISDRELRYAQYQLDFMREQRHSPYWVVQKEKKSNTLARYSDKYRPAEQELPSLKTVKMNKAFFPADIWDSYMEGVDRRERANARAQMRTNAAASGSRLSALDRLTAANSAAGGLDEDDDDARRARMEAEQQDAEEEEQNREMMGEYEDEEDDDYVFSYFDNGEGGDEDGLGDGGGGDDGGDYD
ncbi:hypothetical protein OC834_004529 [Tilletia horrida]|uniref:DNA-directed RNA polymerase III subunit n=1 Tax=Tilletia horrida TaxID=155126 RepID=A0AAN6JPZ7_9BASI|nr:hypothetical protein OC834_004529 [Tilletia horrida]KAK0527787.1 hypothetical protein OC842_004763 [Tilletia horrida]KAK0535439.1 hypothetical protein OC835_002352 [Tilletia horrida]KAK0550138.1 hypothetical protein OC844_006765 [Tilletia horrida]